MMTGLTLLLAESDPVMKVVVGVVFAAIWLIAQAASAWNDRKKKAPPSLPRQQTRVETPPPLRVPQNRQQRGDTPQQRRRPQNVSAQRPAEAAASERSARERQEMGQVRRTASEALTHAVPPPQGKPPRLKPAAARSKAGPAQQMDAALANVYDKKESEGPSDRSRLQALLRPKNLRKEFILTELLQKPVGLRDA